MFITCHDKKVDADLHRMTGGKEDVIGDHIAHRNIRTGL